jgi:hypothetical protein
VEKTTWQNALCSAFRTKYYSDDQIKEMGRACGTYEGRTGAYRVLVGKPEGKRPLGNPGNRWYGNIKMHLQEVGWGAWTGLVWFRIGIGGRLS